MQFQLLRENTPQNVAIDEVENTEPGEEEIARWEKLMQVEGLD